MLPSPRLVNLGGFLICAGLMAYALYQQHTIGLDPCPLCVFQRIAVTGIGLVFLVAFLHGPGRLFSLLYAVLGGLFAVLGIVVAGRHLWLQSLPPDRVPACGPGLEYMLQSFPPLEVVQMVFSGSGECAEVDWAFLGLAMPGWVLIWCVILGVVIVANALRVPPGPPPQVPPDPVQFRAPPSSASRMSR